MNSVIAKVSKNPVAVVKLLEEYDNLLDIAKASFELEGKKLEVLCRDHPKNVLFYRSRLGELRSLEDFFKLKADEIASVHWKKYNEKHSRALTQKDIQQYIAGEPDYVQQWELVLEIVHMRKQYEAVVDALSDMSWMLGHVVKLRVADMELAVL